MFGKSVNMKTALKFDMVVFMVVKCIWYHQFASADVDPRSELIKYGHWVPLAVKKMFYNF